MKGVSRLRVRTLQSKASSAVVELHDNASPVAFFRYLDRFTERCPNKVNRLAQSVDCGLVLQLSKVEVKHYVV